MVEAVGTSAIAAINESNTATQKLNEDFDQFLNLLVTQLKHQDPLDPMDPSELTSQLVQFSMVEQQLAGNALLEDMLSIQTESLLGTAVGYIGSQVEVSGNKMPLENGIGRADYELDSQSVSTTISITDSGGEVVFFASGETSPGKHSFVWDGTDSFGFPLDDDIYTVNVTGLDTAGAPVGITQTITGTVTGVSMADGQATLTLGTSRFVEYGVDQVIGVRLALVFVENPPEEATE